MSPQNPRSNPSHLPEYANLDNYGQAFFLARHELAHVNLEERCTQAGAALIRREDFFEIHLPFLNDHIIITLRPPDTEFEFRYSSGGEVPLTEKILSLHYLLTASGTPAAGEWIGFEAVPDGRLYLSNFLARTHRPLLKKFGNNPDLFIETARKTGGEKTEQGDCSARFQAFPKVPIIIIIWLGDEDLDPEVKIIFDKNITTHLSAEDVVILCNLLAVRMVKLAG